MVSIIDAVTDFCRAQGFDKTFWVAYSGGLDSHVLLHTLVSLREKFPIKLRAIHIHHGLSQNADAWFDHCKEVCDTLKIEWMGRRISAKAAVGESPEETARRFRYAAFIELLSTEDILLTAHHQNDQAETVLLQLLRGAGPKGLAAMPSIKKLGTSQQARPLLDITRQELIAYATKHQLKWIEDESNANVSYSRNFIRHQIMPLLADRWSTVSKTLSRVAENCAEAQELLELFAQDDLVAAQGSVPNTLSVSYLKQLPPARGRLVLREWLRRQNLSAPSTKKMQQILKDMLFAGENKAPHVHWGKAELRRYRDDLYVRKYTPKKVMQDEKIWQLAEPLVIPGVGTLRAVPTRGEGLRADINQVIVRFRQGREKIQLPGRQMRHSLKKLFQQWKVLPWERDQVPLIFQRNELMAVVGFALGEKFMAGPEEEGYLLMLE